MELPQSRRLSSGVSQTSVFILMLFIIYISDADITLSNLSSKFAHDTQTGNSVLSDENREGFLDLHTISAWSDAWESPYHIDKCQVLQFRTKSYKFYCIMCSMKLKNDQSIMDLSVKIMSNFKFSQLWNDAVNQVNRARLH